jgi:TRAP-type C4-dicarboxylate transport system permease small subunit
MADVDHRSTPTLVGDLVTHVTELFRKEIQLLRAEMSDKSTQIVVALGSIVAAVIVAITALNVLAAALVTALTEAGIPAAWSAVIVGVGLAVLAAILANRGIANLKAQNLAPERTARAAVRDTDMVREKI